VGFFFCLTVVLALLVGTRLPEVGKYSECIPYLIGLMLLLNFLDVKIKWQHFHLKTLIISLCLTVVVMPLFAYHILSRDLIQPYRVGILLVACAPTGITSLVLSRYIKGASFDLVMGSFLFSTAASVFYIPIVLKLILGGSVLFAKPLFAIVAQLAALVILPYVLSRAIGALLTPRWLPVIEKTIQGLTPLLLFVIVAVSVAKVAERLSWRGESLQLPFAVAAIYLTHGGMGYLFACWLKKDQLKKTLPLIYSSRNIQLVFAVAVLNFNSLTCVPIIMGIFLHHLTNAFWIWVLGKHRLHAR